MKNTVRNIVVHKAKSIHKSRLPVPAEGIGGAEFSQETNAIINQIREIFPEQYEDFLKHIDVLSNAPEHVQASIGELIKHFSQVGERLQQSEDRFRLAFEGARDGLFDWDIINDKAYFSAKFREMMGYPAQDYIDGINALTRVVHPDDLAPTMEAIQNHLQHKQPFFHYYRLRNTSGEYRHYLVKGQAVWNKEGVPTRMAGSLTDLTEDIRLHRLVKEIESTAHVGAWEYNNQTDDFFQTTVAQELFCYREPKFSLEKFASTFKTQECDNIIRESFQNAIKYGKSFDIEVALVPYSNNLRWLRIKADAVLEQGKLQRLVGIVMDITDAKKQEYGLIRSQRRWKSIFTNISDLVTVVNIEGKILFQSASVRTLLGYSEAELSGKKVFEFIPVEEVGILKQAFKNAKANSGIGSPVELSIKSKFGTLVYLEAQANNQLGNPDIEAIIITCRVITDRKKNEKALIQKSKLLEAITKSSSIFVSDVEWTDILQNVFHQIAPLLEVDRAYFFEAIQQSGINDRHMYKQVVEWAKDPSISELHNPELQAFDLAMHAELSDKLLNDELFVADVADIVEGDFRKLLESQDIASVIVMPVFVRAKLKGFMGFDACYVKRLWSGDEIATLKLLVSVVAAAIDARIVKDELQLNNKRYEYIAQATDDILWEYYVADKITRYWGSGFRHVFGYQWLSNTRTIDERIMLIHPDDRDKVISSFEDFLRTGGEFWEESYRYKKMDGSYVYILDKAMALKNSEGVVQSVIGSMRDITFLKEQELQRSFLLFANNCFKTNTTTSAVLACVIDNAAHMVGAQYAEAWEVDVSGEQLLYKAKWSATGEDVFKKPFVITRLNQEKGVIGECWKTKSIIWQPGLENSKFLKKQEAADAGLRSLLCVPLLCKDQVVAILTFFYSTPEQLSKNFITFFEQVNQQLGELLVQKQLEIQLNTFFDHSPALLCITSGTKFIKVNSSFSRLLGYSEQELLERPFHDFLHPDDILSTINATEFLLKKGTVHRFKNRYVTKDGKIIWLEWNSAFLDDNNISYSIAYDVTKERVLEMQLEKERRDRVNEVAEAAILAQEHEKEELARELHDNVNQILATSLMYLSLVKISDKKQHDNLNQAIAAVKESIKEIRQLSHALSSANLNDHDLHFALINLFSIIKESKGIEVRHEIDLLLSGNFSHKLKLNIYRIIQEQFNNIYKHAQASLVVIEIFTDEDWIVLRIKDNGIGKNAEKFESGIGLLNIRSRVDLFNGKMEVNTAIGQGFELIAYFIDR
jgi:PAS domain S-box-containing protein